MTGSALFAVSCQPEKWLYLACSSHRIRTSKISRQAIFTSLENNAGYPQPADYRPHVGIVRRGSADGEAHFLTLALFCQRFYRNTSLLVSATRFLLPRRLHNIWVIPAGLPRYITLRVLPRRHTLFTSSAALAIFSCGKNRA